MKQSNKSTRAEKLKLLNDLKTGKTTINEVFPVLPEHWVYETGRGIYSRGDQELNEDEFKAMKKRKGKDWLFNILKLNDIIGKECETISNCKNFEWPYNAAPPLDEKQVDKIITSARLHAKTGQLKKF